MAFVTVANRPNKPWPFRIEYPPELPISARADEIIAALAITRC